MEDSIHNSTDELPKVPISNEKMESLLLLQQEILGQVAIGDQYHYQDLLDSLCLSAERMLPNSLASIMLFDDDNKESLTVKSAPSIPLEAINALNGLVPGQYSGSCGTAVFTHSPQFVCDTRNDPRWSADDLQSFADVYGVDACWSMPIKGEKKSVIGSFALSSMEKRQPHFFHKKLLEVCADIIAIVLKRESEKKELKHLAHHDLLTDLPNRILFADRFNQAAESANKSNKLLALCFFDLDDFKPINDEYGHSVGDQLLISVAIRIKAILKDKDTVSRQGGDEFAILLSDMASYQQCEQVLQRIHHSLAQPYFIGDNIHTITVSTGIALYSASARDVDTLLRQADQAMYQAKQSGRNKYHLFNAEQDKKTVLKNHQLAEVEHALLNNELTLYLQPKVNMLTGKVFGAEALIRWNHPQKGLLLPLDFLPLIDSTDLEVRVGDWVIHQALQQLDSWLQQGIKLEISVNIASYYLQSARFVSKLNEALECYPAVASKYLQLEVLESSALGDLEAISNIIKVCQKTLGVSVALDDFGTGYSSLTHLRSLTANTIKIDQSFVRDILDSPSDYSIINGIIGLADSFNREVIAEGVETTNHGLMLMMMGCEEAQGYGIAKPMPADDLLNWLSQYVPNQDWINLAKQHRSTKENKVALFNLIADHWKMLFVENVQTLSAADRQWPIMNSKHCLCGTWIQRALQEQLFAQAPLELLENAHEEVHRLASVIQFEIEAGRAEGVQQSLTELHTVFDKMKSCIPQCE